MFGRDEWFEEELKLMDGDGAVGGGRTKESGTGNAMGVSCNTELKRLQRTGEWPSSMMQRTVSFTKGCYASGARPTVTSSNWLAFQRSSSFRIRHLSTKSTISFDHLSEEREGALSIKTVFIIEKLENP